mmetsp:Transcript_26546/g.79528  ORF Transcript_26546/g.79528 Transcript_26546/m.79528 type:complete len:267 (-) Transcript_26546:102-902(-)
MTVNLQNPVDLQNLRLPQSRGRWRRLRPRRRHRRRARLGVRLRELRLIEPDILRPHRGRGRALLALLQRARSLLADTGREQVSLRLDLDATDLLGTLAVFPRCGASPLLGRHVPRPAFSVGGRALGEHWRGNPVLHWERWRDAPTAERDRPHGGDANRGGACASRTGGPQPMQRRRQVGVDPSLCAERRRRRHEPGGGSPGASLGGASHQPRQQMRLARDRRDLGRRHQLRRPEAVCLSRRRGARCQMPRLRLLLLQGLMVLMRRL